ADGETIEAPGFGDRSREPFDLPCGGQLGDGEAILPERITDHETAALLAQEVTVVVQEFEIGEIGDSVTILETLQRFTREEVQRGSGHAQGIAIVADLKRRQFERAG